MDFLTRNPSVDFGLSSNEKLYIDRYRSSESIVIKKIQSNPSQPISSGCQSGSDYDGLVLDGMGDEGEFQV